MRNTGKRGGGSTVAVRGTAGVEKVETLGGAIDLPLPPLPRPRPDIPMAGEEEEFSIYTTGLEPDRDQAVLITHHGAGYSALSFATFAKALRTNHPDVAIVSMDARAHGATPGSEADLSISTLCADFGAVIKCMRQQWTAPHSIFLAGHSLGGSVAIWTVLKGLIEDVAGVIVIDIVEEAALRALTTMPRVLEERPQNFPSIEDAIRWAIHEKISRNPQSASISIPDQLCITEDECRWKVDLMKSQPHWDGWFRGLSEAFVECPTPRVLILAEREYLDRTLMIASMQGKFQNNILRGTGHAIQEDLPDELAELVGTFIDRGLLVARLNRGRTEIIR